LSASTTLPRRLAPSAPSLSPSLSPYFSGSKQWLECLLVVLLFPAWALLLALIFLVLLIPLGGRVLLAQTRTGRNGRIFKFYKFRTLKSAIDAPLNKVKAITPPEAVFLGGWLRRTGLDELPQLINVLKGDMHIVGPRPFLARDLTHLSEEQSLQRHAIKPGLTGLWQVTRRYDDTDIKFADVDREYVRTASVWLDLRILCLTVGYGLRRRGR
jgi:lipopolysaccharide/colanic/teichoic acid biosynthesis glycosyltransferase